MAKQAVIIYGPPGGGKGTQANLLSWAKGFIHFDTGKYLESVVHDPVNKKNKEIQRERKMFDEGILLTPSWVLNVVREKTEEISRAGFSITYSGSPRTVFETFGDAKNTGLIDILEKLYGKKNIKIFHLKVSPKSSVFRNSNRKLCSICGTGLMYSDATHKHTHCPICGGKLRTRTLDKPEVIKVRLKEFKERTFPILAGLKERGYKIQEINGEPKPFEVHKQILKHL